MVGSYSIFDTGNNNHCFCGLLVSSSLAGLVRLIKSFSDNKMRQGFNIGPPRFILNMSSESNQGGQTVSGHTKQPRTFQKVLHGVEIECQKQYNL